MNSDFSEVCNKKVADNANLYGDFELYEDLAYITTASMNPTTDK